MTDKLEFKPWNKDPVVDVRCGACPNTLLAQIYQRGDRLHWHTRSIAIQRFGRRLDRSLGREIDLPMPEDLAADGVAEFFAVVCKKHGQMLPPVPDLERAMRSSDRVVRVYPDRHRYGGG